MAITTKVSQIIIRKDNASEIPTLGAGEFMLAEDEQRLFLGQKPLEGALVSSTTTEASISFTVPIGGVQTPLYLSNLADYSIVVTRALDSSTTTVPSGPTTIVVSDPDGEGNNPPVYALQHGISDTAGSFIVGKLYKIATVGTTDFTAIGAANNNVGTEFTANAVGTGTGTAHTGPVAGDTFVLHYNKEITSSPTDDRVKRSAIKFTNTGGQTETTGITFTTGGDSGMNDITMDYTLVNPSLSKMRKGTLNILASGNTASNIEDKFFGDNELTDVEFSLTNNGSGTFTLKFKTALTTELQFNYTQTASKFVTT